MEVVLLVMSTLMSTMVMTATVPELESALDDLEAILEANKDEVDNDANDIEGDLSDEMNVAAALRRRLPHIRAQVRQLARTASNFSFLIGLMSDSQKIQFAHSQLARFRSEVALFKALPVWIQERMLGHLLSRNDEARQVFMDNLGVIGALGFDFNVQLVLQLASNNRMPRHSYVI